MEKNDRRPCPGSYDMKIYTIPCNTFITKLKLSFFQFAPMRGFLLLRSFHRFRRLAINSRDQRFPQSLPQELSEGLFQFLTSINLARREIREAIPVPAMKRPVVSGNQ